MEAGKSFHILRRLALVCAIALLATIAADCSAERSDPPCDATSNSQLLVERAIHAALPEVLALIDKREQPSDRSVIWSNVHTPVRAQRDATGAVFMMLDCAFWQEHERLLEGALLAAELNVRPKLRRFALTRAQLLSANPLSRTASHAEEFWKVLGLDHTQYARLRERPEFEKELDILRRQAVIWSLSRSLPQDLASEIGKPIKRMELDRRAAEISFELHGTPSPPLVTALLTAAVKSDDSAPSDAMLLCQSARWFDIGVGVLQSNDGFRRRLSESESLRKYVNRMLEGIDELHREGSCEMSR